jgi:hypothetical protein
MEYFLSMFEKENVPQSTKNDLYIILPKLRGKSGAMRELLIIGLAFCALISLVLSVVFIKFGEIIDRFPSGEEEERDRSRWSPVEFSRISVMIFWPLFISGGLMVLQQSRILMVLGIAILFGLILFLLTAVLFSLGVINLMKAHKSGNGI